MKTYRLPNTGIQATAAHPARSGASRFGRVWVGITGVMLLACAGVTVFASARVMVSSHTLAALHAEQSEVQQDIRYLETEYADVSSLERVSVFAQQAELVNSAKIAGTVSETISVAQRTQ